MPRLYLVDGMSHIYRAYHAVQGLTNSKGLPTNAIYGFTNMLRKLVREEQPEYLGVAIDRPGPTLRHEKFAQYKANRKPMPEDLGQQLPYISRVCEVLEIPMISMPGYEADDVIGTLSRQAEAQGLEVVIVTIDKDMFQLVNDRVTVLDTRTMSRLDQAGVKEKFGVAPSQVVDVLSLVGDSSDNIPGAPGIGEKGARSLISDYENLENLLAHRNEITRKTYRESLIQNEELVLKSRDLVTIHRDLPIALELEQLRLSEPDQEAARALFADLEFKVLVEEFSEERTLEDSTLRVFAGAKDLAFLKETLGQAPAAVALELSDADYRVAKLDRVALVWEDSECWLIEGKHLSLVDVGDLWDCPDPLVVHDLKPWLALSGRETGECADTCLMAYLLDPNQKDFSLTQLGLDYLNYRLPVDPSESNGAEDGGKKLCGLARLTFELHQVLSARIAERDLQTVLEDIELPLVPVLVDMEAVGVRIDGAVLEELSLELELEIAHATEDIFRLSGCEFNLNSPKQLAQVLFEDMKLPTSRKTRKGGHQSTGQAVLEDLAVDHEIARLILDYREMSKLKTTYLDALPKLVDTHTGRIHSSYNQTVAATGRLSSSNPNLQNIPVRSELGRRVRKAFIPEEGFRILAADYSQLELRIMAHLSEDPVLLDCFEKGQDIHARTALEIFGMNAKLEPDRFRRQAKVVNFGIMYGLSAFGLARNLKIERKEAQRIIDGYFARYKGVQDWIQRTLEEVRSSGVVKTLFGRIRPIPEINSKNWSLRSFGERTAINAPIQGTEADFIKKAMIAGHKELKTRQLRSRLILQVHDELVLEVANGEEDEVSQLVREAMEGVAQLRVPLEVDLAIGDNWLEAK